jgi:hypothetical protein
MPRACRHLFRRFPVVRPRGDKRFVNQAFPDDDVEHPVSERDIRAGLELEVQVALSRGRRLARVDDDPAASVVALLP